MDSFGTRATTISPQVHQNRKVGKDLGTKYHIEWTLKHEMWTRTQNGEEQEKWGGEQGDSEGDGNEIVHLYRYILEILKLA